MEKFRELFESKEFRYALNVDGPSKDGRYLSKDLEKELKKIDGYVSIRHGKPGLKSMVTIKADNVHDGFDTLNDYFMDSDWDVEVTEI